MVRVPLSLDFGLGFFVLGQGVIRPFSLSVYISPDLMGLLKMYFNSLKQTGPVRGAFILLSLWGQGQIHLNPAFLKHKMT